MVEKLDHSYKDFHLWTVGDGITLMVCIRLFISLITTVSDTSCF
uniref:Uncharacterized protein n=1 Tax=Solanum lycopersicum TaxID=4081 RepID=A0A3Q7HB80_SOLLC